MSQSVDYSSQKAEIFSGSKTCESIVLDFHERINANSHLNAFLEVFEEESLIRAKSIDLKIKDGSAGKLAGMVVAIKDNICYEGHKVSASSKILEGFVSLYSSTAVERLLEEDAIIIGRTNCDEFAMGSSNENSAFGNVLNPLDNSKVSGGSSGGSAAVVAAGLCHAALGSDTGGSIRQPASFCGVVGLRPTYGRVSRHGLLSFASSFDQIGTLTNSLADSAVLLEVISGYDEWDATVSVKPVERYSEARGGKNFKVAFLTDCIGQEGVDSEIKKCFAEIKEGLLNENVEVKNLTFPYLDYMIPSYYVLATAEASSNLSRYTGNHYGYRTAVKANLDETITLSRSEGFGEEVKRRIMLGTFVLSAGYYDAYYNKAQKVRKVVKDYTLKQLEEVDFILLPTAPTTPFGFGDNTADPISMYLADIFTIQSALAGIPSISLPLGKHSNGLPFGIQVMGKSFDEYNMFRLSTFLMEYFQTKN